MFYFVDESSFAFSFAFNSLRYRRVLYFSSNSLPSRSLSSVKGCLQCIQASTRPNIFVGFSQFGHMIGTALVDKRPIQKYTTVLNTMQMIPRMNKMTISQAYFRAQIPKYMIIIPANIRMRANERILFILLE